jgi:hypothetical protein
MKNEIFWVITLDSTQQEFDFTVFDFTFKPYSKRCSKLCMLIFLLLPPPPPPPPPLITLLQFSFVRLMLIA